MRLDNTIRAEDLDEVDMVVRGPSVVLSVRLDGITARQLHAIAKHRGSRISDVLRDAATDYARQGMTEVTGSLELIGADVRILVGTRSVDTAIGWSGSIGQGGRTSLPWRQADAVREAS